MKPTARSTAPHALRIPMDPLRDISVLSHEILQRVREQISLEAALFVIGNPLQVIDPDGFPIERLRELKQRFESQPELLSDLGNRRNPFQPLSFSDGSAISLLPIVHQEILEGVLCLHHKDPAKNHLQPQQLKLLLSICEMSAPAMAQLRAVQEKPAEDSLAPMAFIASSLTGIIAHDLRTPITVIRGYLKMLLNDRIGPVTEDQRKCIEGALISVGQLTNITGTVGRASEAVEQLHPEVFNIQELWRKSRNSISSQAQERSVILKEQLPAAPFMVCGDRRMLCNVVERLAVCAIAAAAPGTDLLVEALTWKSGNVVLKMTFNCASSAPDVENVVSELQASVFLHGGQLALNSRTEGESSFTLSLSLPGYRS